MITFKELGLSNNVFQAISHMGFEETTPIQDKTIPLALEGQDILVQVHNATGKTVAYGIPMVEMLNANLEGIQGLVLTSTRELAVQVAEELNRIGRFKGIRALPIYGGQDIERQIKTLKKRPHIIAVTPGRLMDHMRRKTIRLNQIKMVVMDEVDEMLNLGFSEDIELILQDTPDDHQTMVFSANMTDKIEGLAKKYLNNPKIVDIKFHEAPVQNIQQSYIELQENQKYDVLCRLLDTQSPNQVVVFCRTKLRVEELYEALDKRGYSVEGIHGDTPQSKLESVLKQLRVGALEILVTTDSPFKKIDLCNVTNIYNYDIPLDPENYIYRVYGIGRSEVPGMVTTLATPREVTQLKVIESVTTQRIKRLPIPTIKESIDGQQRMAVEKIMTTVTEENISRYKKLAEGLLEETDSVTLLAAALKVLTKEVSKKTTVSPTASYEAAAKNKNGKGKTKGLRNTSQKRGGSRGGKGRSGFSF